MSRIGVICLSVLVILMVVPAPFVHALEWKEVKLSGTFTGPFLYQVPNYTRKGDLWYSFSLARAVSTPGDLTFKVRIYRGETTARLEGGKLHNLGAFSSPPRKVGINLLDRLTVTTWADVFLGHYYYLNKGPLHVLLQVIDLNPGPRIKSNQGKDTYEIRISLTFRYLAATGGLEDLNDLLSGELRQ